jgi:hypothetical protein
MGVPRLPRFMHVVLFVCGHARGERVMYACMHAQPPPVGPLATRLKVYFSSRTFSFGYSHKAILKDGVVKDKKWSGLQLALPNVLKIHL